MTARMPFLEFMAKRFGQHWTTDAGMRSPSIRFIDGVTYLRATQDWKAGRDP